MQSEKIHTVRHFMAELFKIFYKVSTIIYQLLVNLALVDPSLNWLQGIWPPWSVSSTTRTEFHSAIHQGQLRRQLCVLARQNQFQLRQCWNRKASISSPRATILPASRRSNPSRTSGLFWNRRALRNFIRRNGVVENKWSVCFVEFFMLFLMMYSLFSLH